MGEKDSTTIRSSVINKAINYIFENLDENITVEDVARHCSYSKYHLMRMFKEDTDEALYQFIKRVRLERSAWELKVDKKKSITKISEDYGYSPSNFATAFKKHMNLSPADFRRISEQRVEQSPFSQGKTIDEMEPSEKWITVENLESFLYVYERKKGNYRALPKEWCKFIEKYEDLASSETLYVECTVDDPSITDEDNCMYELGQTISLDHPALREKRNIMTHVFEGGKYGVYHFKGYSQFIFLAYQEVFCRWLSRTGNQLDNRPIMDIYRYVGEDGYMEIDICFPLK